MNRDGYIAQAAALEVARVIREGGHFFCPELPAMDIQRFLSALAELTDDVAGVSLALVGYDVSETDLRDRLNAMALLVGHVTTDLHEAAKWRNEPDKHTNIIALATGRYPGVSTLAHFPHGNARTLATGLLDWAQTDQAGLASTPAQQRLLKALAESRALSPLVSLNGIAEFLATWNAALAEDELDAPRRALPRLGVLPDRHLFAAADEIAKRLSQNFRLTQNLAKMSGQGIEAIRRRIRKSPSQHRARRLQILERVEAMRRTGGFDTYSVLDYEDARQILSPPKDDPAPDPPSDPDEEQTDNGLPRDTLDERDVSREGGAALLDGDDQALQDITDRVGQTLRDAIEDDEDTASGGYAVNGDERRFEFKIDRELLTWVRFFCGPDDWGGFFETRHASLEAALQDYGQCEPIRFRPAEASIAHYGEMHDLRSVIRQMQDALHQKGVTSEDFCELWDRIVVARRVVLNDLGFLLHQPALAIAGKPELRAAAAELVQAWERLYNRLARHHTAMHDIDHAWTRMLLEAVASLDVVQIKTRLDARRSSWKAVLLPTHPLHLWRYERMATLARGLGLEKMDRKAVLEQLERPEHYLGVLWLTSFPEGRGGSQPLPVARDYRGLAVFENLRNAYSGSDGVEALQRCVRQFAQIYVNHTQPLRLALVNPPNASQMLLTLLKDSRGRRAPAATLLIDIYATQNHEARLVGARRFSSEDRDQIEEHIANGRLRLRVHDGVTSLEERLRSFHEKPVHILAVFDEATTDMRQQPGGINLLPMSPFAMRRRIAFQGIRGQVELLPSMEGSVFRSFYDMQGKLDAQSGQTPQASADAEQMREHIESVLTDSSPGAFWFFFADRALPSPGGTRVARILERRDGRRRSVCYDASYERLALLLRPPLDQFNLRFSPQQLQELLEEGVILLGDGLINLFGPDGQPDPAQVLGFAGMLIAARDYKEHHPEALLVSVDTRLARLWLRLSDTGERCDLLGLRHEDGTMIVEAIEVKTAGTCGDAVARTEIEKATSQLASTLAAIQSGLEENEESSPLAAPRQEMLKEVFVFGCQALGAGREDRERWVEWLRVLFREIEGASETQLRGTVYAVELSHNGPPEEETLDAVPHAIVLRRVRETQIQALLSPVTAPPPPDDDGAGDPNPPTEDPAPPGRSPAAPAPVSVREDAADSSAAPAPGPRPMAPEPDSGRQGIRFPVGERLGGNARNPLYLHPSNTRLTQLNIGIVGDLGTGKTQLIKALIYRLTRSAEQNRGHAPKFLIFDYKRDYTKPDFVKAVGARVVSPHRIPLNIFDLRTAGDHTPSARLGRVKFLNDALHKIYGGIGPRQRNHLKTAVMQGYETASGGVPTLADVLRAYESVIGDKVDAPYSILSDLVDLEIFVDRAADAHHFNEFFTGVTVVDLASLGIGDRERNMLLVLFLNLYYEYMINVVKRPYVGQDPQLRFINSMLLVDEADNIMKYNFDVLRQILLQGREFGIGVLLASQYLSHFRTRDTDYSEPLLTWFVHKVPNVTSRELESIGLSKVASSTVERVKTLDIHECLYKTLDVPGRFIRTLPFYSIST